MGSSEGKDLALSFNLLQCHGAVHCFPALNCQICSAPLSHLLRGFDRVFRVCNLLRSQCRFHAIFLEGVGRILRESDVLELWERARSSFLECILPARTGMPTTIQVHPVHHDGGW